MKVLFYSHATNGAAEKVKEILDELIPQKNLEIYRSIERLSLRLRQPTFDVGISVLLASAKKELSDLLSIRDQLLDLRIVLILPDHEDGTISQGHTLYPRFLTYSDGNFRDLQAVLNKMLGYLNANYNNQYWR